MRWDSFALNWPILNPNYELKMRSKQQRGAGRPMPFAQASPMSRNLADGVHSFQTTLRPSALVARKQSITITRLRDILRTCRLYSDCPSRKQRPRSAFQFRNSPLPAIAEWLETETPHSESTANLLTDNGSNCAIFSECALILLAN
jgi:hypothetical protein